MHISFTTACPQALIPWDRKISSVFCSGFLTGTGSLFTGRWTLVGKSPLTGGWGDANCGGTFSPAIKHSGYDAIFFKGISDKPVYLYVKNGKATLKDADRALGT